MEKALVLGASGFLGSHIVKQLMERDYSVRIFARPSSDLQATENLEIERMSGNPLDYEELKIAMEGCDTVFHSIVDARAWLRDPTPLYKVNIEGLKASMDAALDTAVNRFIFTSTYAVIGKNPSGISTEADHFHWEEGEPPHYVSCRMAAEQLVMEYYKNRGLPVVIGNVGNTYGEADFQPTPHGKLLKDVARGRLPFYWEGGGPTVNIRNAAQGMLLLAEKGRVGERYILAGEYVTFRDLLFMAAKAAGRRPPGFKMSNRSLAFMGALAELVTRPFGIENKLNKDSIQCSQKLPAVSSEKAIDELGWDPGSAEIAVKEAVDWYMSHQFRHQRIVAAQKRNPL